MHHHGKLDVFLLLQLLCIAVFTSEEFVTAAASMIYHCSDYELQLKQV